ncbi:hypothetical protein BH23PLA1_BH23PLA1_32360 [soil metagenome]
MSRSSVEIARCPAPERASALDLLYRHTASVIRSKVLADLLQEADRGELDLSGLWIARRRGRIVGVLMSQALASRSAALWPPEVVCAWGRNPALAEQLVRVVLEDYRARGFRLAQALIDGESHRHAASDLERGGLPHVTDLLYMVRSLTETSGPEAQAVSSRDRPRWQWLAYGPETEAEFAEVLQQTYIGSLDMPELEGVRGLEDILAGQRAGGRLDPTCWRLGRLPDEPEAASVLLLAPGNEASTWEVSYLGLTPQARGRGLGQQALAHALELARPHARRLELAVDIRNRPAEQLYRRAGFRPFDRRGVHVAVLQSK